MDEAGVIAARIRGESIEKIAKAQRVSVAEVHAVFDRFCDRRGRARLLFVTVVAQSGDELARDFCFACSVGVSE